MKFGALSEADIQKISQVLEAEGVPYTVGKDTHIEEFNSASMKNDLRHYSPPNISTHILAITIEDQDFQRLSPSAREKLLDFGITDQAPVMEDFEAEEAQTIHSELLHGPRRMVGMNFKHQLIAGLILLGIYFLLTKFS